MSTELDPSGAKVKKKFNTMHAIAEVAAIVLKLYTLWLRRVAIRTQPIPNPKYNIPAQI
jgi:hypothetical protein